MARFNRVTIIGLGLIGGSLGMALRRRGIRVTGYSRKPATLRAAKRRGAIDVGTTNLRAAVRAADLIVLATPVDAIVPFARQAARFCRRGAILTDVGSTKDHVVQSLERSLPRHVSFVGAHPVAGSEQRGINAARSDLFSGAVCVVTPTARSARRALQDVKRLWSRVGMRVITMSPRDHDQLLAATSHLPHLIAACLSTAHPGRLPTVAPSFLDMTRIAQSDPDLWDDIFLTNRRPLLDAIDHFDRQWRALRSYLSRADRTQLLSLLKSAKSKRDAIRDP